MPASAGSSPSPSPPDVNSGLGLLEVLRESRSFRVAGEWLDQKLASRSTTNDNAPRTPPHPR